MIHLDGTNWACSLASSTDEKLTPPGCLHHQSFLAYTCNVNMPHLLLEFERLDQDVAAGLLATVDGSIIRIWDVSNRAELSAVAGDAERMTQVAFPADGRFLSTSSADRRTVLWAFYP